MFCLVVLVAVISIIGGSDTEGSDCKVQICFTWKVVDKCLILKCKVNANQFTVTFYDPQHKETGFCVPSPTNVTCKSLLSGATITSTFANDSVYETDFIFKENVGSRYNGNWKCSYGYQNIEANVDVEIYAADGQDKSRISCWQYMMFWALFGFGIAFFVGHCILLSIRKLTTLDLPSSIDIKGGKGKVLLIITFIVSGVLLFCTPLVIGLVEKTNCKAEPVFVLLGIAVGFYVHIFLYLKDSFIITHQATHAVVSTDDSETDV